MNSVPPTFQESLDELARLTEACASLSDAVDASGAAILTALRSGNKLMTCGNGGSAADALHLAEELVGRYSRERRALAGLCLNADPTAITCICNDYGYEHVFSRAVEALGKPGDVLVGFTTSGNSGNVLKAFEAAAKRGITTVLLSGKDGGKARGGCDHEIIVPSENTARIQEIHTLVLHQWLEVIDGFPWPEEEN
jgi:D-sedoheptulose 7-phosphate isomerase